MFDAYPADVLAARRSHVITGLPDAYGRGRIIGDYRRVPLYGVDRLIAAKQAEKAALDAHPSTADIIRDREELAEQIRALTELVEMAASYGHDVTRPAATAREAIQWLYLAYLAAVKEQNGAAMSLGRTSTFLDIYLERDLARAGAPSAGAGACRRLRDQAADRPVPAHPGVRRAVLRRPDLGHRVDRRDRPRRPPAGHPHQLPLPADAIQPRAAPEPNLTVLWSPALPDGFKRFCAQVSVDTSSIQYESDDLLRARWGDDTAIACCVSAMEVGKQMQFFGARVNLAKTLLYAINGGRDENSGVQVGPSLPPLTGDVLDYDEVVARFDTMMDWLAKTYVDALNVIHYMHDKYAYERLEMALHDYGVMRTMACGIAGLSVTADSLAAIKYATVRPVRDDTGLVVDYHIDGEFPAYGNDDDLADDIAVGLVRTFMDKIRQHETYRNALHTQSVLTITSNVVYGKHTGSTPDGWRGRAVRARGEPDERPRPAWPGRRRAVGREAAVQPRRGRHLPDRDHHPGRARPHRRRADRQPRRRPRRVRRLRRFPHERQRARPRHPARRDGSSRALPAADDPGLRVRGQLRPAHPRTAARRGRRTFHGSV